MKVVGHYDEFVKEKSFFSAILKETAHEQSGHPFGLKNGATRFGGGSDEECTQRLVGKYVNK
jgi:hypothetical protein